MNRYILFIALMVGIVSVMCQKTVFGDVSVNEQDAAVTMTITKLQVNYQTLELSWKIVNRSDHDVWILDKFHLFEPSIEVYLADDNYSLVIRRRLDVPSFGVWFATPEGRYVRMRPGEERLESLSLDIPISASWLFAGGQWSALSSGVIKSIKLEIGYYDEDLPRLIRGILAEAEKHSPTISDDSHGVLADYFPGLLVYFACGGLSDFEASYKNESDDIWVPYTYQALKGEQVLRVTVDGVSIPFGEVPAADEPSQSETEPAGVTMALTGLDVNDTKLELSYKIKNNTDHDVWICDDVSVFTPTDFEVYLSEDEQSLLIRRRFDVPTTVYWAALPYGRYVLLRSDQERTESLSLDVPVDPRRFFATELAISDRARRLVLEIGFYNEDLPKLIRDILEMEEKLNCARLEFNSNYPRAFFARYFKGIWISQLFGGLSGFESFAYKEGSEEIKIPYSHYTRQNFNDEQVLRIEVDGVHIPYEEVQSPFQGAGDPNGPVVPKGKTCFLAETPVWVDGMIVPISKVVAGQAIRRSLCTTPGPWPTRVEEIQEHIGTFECRDIVLESGNHIGVVGAHCFMLDSGEWIAAQDLKSGLSLRTLQGTVRIKSVTVRAAPYTGKVYNLKIKNSDEYIAGRDAVIVRDY